MKRSFDIIFSFIGLVFFFPLIFLCWFVACIDTRSNGFYFQKRVGYHGKLFNIIKIKTMRPDGHNLTTITRANDPRITRSGILFRKTKLDELPQLFNVLIGDMSIVGPRPDVPGYADQLEDYERNVLLSVRPGITGPASLAYRNEEQILAAHPDHILYNNEFIYTDKVRINLEYIKNWHFGCVI
uniref:sugar transferase n=1 Tax=Flavobacterium sp. TaxID=239 RepID=UPI004048BA7D